MADMNNKSRTLSAAERMNREISETERAQAQLRSQRVWTWVSLIAVLVITFAGGLVLLVNGLDATFLGGIAVVGAILTIVCSGCRVLSQAGGLAGKGKDLIEAMAAQTPLIASVTAAAAVIGATLKIGG